MGYTLSGSFYKSNVGGVYLNSSFVADDDCLAYGPFICRATTLSAKSGLLVASKLCGKRLVADARCSKSLTYLSIHIHLMVRIDLKIYEGLKLLQCLECVVTNPDGAGLYRVGNFKHLGNVFRHDCRCQTVFGSITPFNDILRIGKLDDALYDVFGFAMIRNRAVWERKIE